MSLLRLSLVSIACGAAAFAEARAEDLTAQPPHPIRATKAKAPKPAKPPSSQDLDLGSIKFSNPYAPPEGAAAVTKRPPSASLYSYPAPTEPKGGLSVNVGSGGGGLRLGF